MDLNNRVAAGLARVVAAVNAVNAKVNALPVSAVTSGQKQLTYANGRLSNVTDTSGKAVALAYANGRLATVTATGTGQTVTKTLAYTAGGALDKVTAVVT